MKNGIRILLCILALCLLTACGNGNGNDAVSVRGRSQSSGVRDALDKIIDEEKSTPEPTPEPTAVPQPKESEPPAVTLPPETSDSPLPPSDSADAAGTDTVDVDLTLYSGTTLYSKIVNIYNEKDQYIGKTIKIRGRFSVYHDESAGQYYFSCTVMDNTACCAVGIEFILPDSFRYPEDYPEIGKEICVTGVLDTYREDGYTYCTLRNAKLL